MRLWSIHPKYLDTKGLLALWREALLAQHVLLGLTKGYKNHPQLDRFKKQKDPISAMGAFLWNIVKEAKKRGYEFDESKIREKSAIKKSGIIKVTDGQITYEVEHLKKKLKVRDKGKYKELNILQ